jgi:peptide chain release factor 2
MSRSLIRTTSTIYAALSRRWNSTLSHKGFLNRLETQRALLRRLAGNVEDVSRIEDLEAKFDDPDIWESSPVKAQQYSRDLHAAKQRVEMISALQNTLQELEDLYALAEEESDNAVILDCQNTLEEFCIKAKKVQLAAVLTSEYDQKDAFMEIIAGAGGIDSRDWAGMLASMYCRYLTDKQMSVEVVELSTDKSIDQKLLKNTVLSNNTNQHGGVRRVTLSVKGDNAHGLMKAEAGTHRLVRLSPFDSANRRHTSFAQIIVYPDLSFTNIEDNISIPENELKVDTFKASGAGGQHVNTTDSAIRITHLPTNLKVTVQNERSQHRNRATALKILNAKLNILHQQRQQEQRVSSLSGTSNGGSNKASSTTISEKGFASEEKVRSYVLHPYEMVKDHRTGWESNQVLALLEDGGAEYGLMDDCILTTLLHAQKKQDDV